MAELHFPRRSVLRGTLRRRGIYLLPNLFTTGVLFGGFFAIVQAMNARYGWAAIAIFAAMIFDFLDGWVARLTRTQSEFGAEYDSLADVVAFGVAPALVMYEWALRPLDRVGWIAAFAYCAATALRLARFNVNIDVVDKRFFQGMPSPSAAALLAGLVWVVDDLELERADWLHWLACILTLFAAVTMVSNVPFFSLKGVNLRRSVPFWVMLAVVLAVMVISARPPVVLFALFVAYSFSGYAMWAWNFRKSRRQTQVP
jgi:CDP-diacylglycerol--serine O-phosphatidyltransferase